MRIRCWLTFAGVLSGCIVFGQVKRQFNVEDSQVCENIKLTVKANSGNCFIKPSQNTDILDVFSNHQVESFSHNFVKEIKGKTCDVKLSLEEEESNGFSQTLSSRFFGVAEKSGKEDNSWKMYLTEFKPYSLELNYGVGNATVDLSGLSISKLKINTGSADVSIGYNHMENKVDMDTFFVKVDLGTVQVRHLNLSRSKCVLAEVGFGNMIMDFSDKPSVSNNIKGSVGAGTLTILLPGKDTPVLVKIHNSWLCRVNLTKDLKEISDNTFANDAYLKNANNSLSFDLDVSMGSISFK